MDKPKKKENPTCYCDGSGNDVSGYCNCEFTHNDTIDQYEAYNKSRELDVAKIGRGYGAKSDMGEDDLKRYESDKEAWGPHIQKIKDVVEGKFSKPEIKTSKSYITLKESLKIKSLILCHEIEELPASEKQTELACKAASLFNDIVDLVAEMNGEGKI